jgi:hypothetical protein
MPVRLPLNTLRNPLKTLRAHTQTSSMRTPTFNAHFQRNSRSPSKTRCMHKKSRKRPTCPRNSLNVRMKPKSEKSDHSIKSAADDGCISHTCAAKSGLGKPSPQNTIPQTGHPDIWHLGTEHPGTEHMPCWTHDTEHLEHQTYGHMAHNIKHIGHMAQNMVHMLDTCVPLLNMDTYWFETWHTY